MKGHKIKHIKTIRHVYFYKIAKCASREIEFFYIVMIYLVKLSIFPRHWVLLDWSLSINFSSRVGILVGFSYQLTQPEKGLPRSGRPVVMSVGVILTINWCCRTLFTTIAPPPRQIALGCTRRLWASERGSEEHSSMVFASSPCLSSCLDFH